MKMNIKGVFSGHSSGSRSRSIKWSDVCVGDSFVDGSVVIRKHPVYQAPCYCVKYTKGFEQKEMILSETHLLLCDTSRMRRSSRQWVGKEFGGYVIPTLVDRHATIEEDILEAGLTHEELMGLMRDIGVYSGPVEHELEQPTSNMNVKNEVQATERQDGDMTDIESRNNTDGNVYDRAVSADESKVGKNLFWLPVQFLADAVRTGERIYCNGWRLREFEWVGHRDVFCVETNSHRFETKGLIHHNSVTLRNIIFHCVTHSNEIKIAMVDLKYTEMTYWKGVNGVVAVANTVKECAEILRIQRECMYKRNQEMSQLKPPINDIKDFKPKKPTREVIILNHKFKDSDTIEIRKGGQVQEVTVGELENYL